MWIMDERVEHIHIVVERKLARVQERLGVAKQGNLLAVRQFVDIVNESL